MGATIGPVTGTLEADETCRACPARIAWALTHKGARQPIDLEPVANGNIALYQETEHGYPRSSVLGPLDEAIGDRYVTHFATCPEAPRFRSDRRVPARGMGQR